MKLSEQKTMQAKVLRTIQAKPEEDWNTTKLKKQVEGGENRVQMAINQLKEKGDLIAKYKGNEPFLEIAPIGGGNKNED